MIYLVIQHHVVIGRIIAILLTRAVLQNHNAEDTDLDPLIAYSLLLTSQAISIKLASRNIDQTIVVLDRIAQDVFISILNKDASSVVQLKELSNMKKFWVF